MKSSALLQTHLQKTFGGNTGQRQATDSGKGRLCQGVTSSSGKGSELEVGRRRRRHRRRKALAPRESSSLGVTRSRSVAAIGASEQDRRKRRRLIEKDCSYASSASLDTEFCSSTDSVSDLEPLEPMICQSTTALRPKSRSLSSCSTSSQSSETAQSVPIETAQRLEAGSSLPQIEEGMRVEVNRPMRGSTQRHIGTVVQVSSVFRQCLIRYEKDSSEGWENLTAVGLVTDPEQEEGQGLARETIESARQMPATLGLAVPKPTQEPTVSGSLPSSSLRCTRCRMMCLKLLTPAGGSGGICLFCLRNQREGRPPAITRESLFFAGPPSIAQLKALFRQRRGVHRGSTPGTQFM